MTNPRTALIVDDERDIRELLVLTLGRMGLRVDTAADVGEARAQLAANRYDLCFTDMRLPDGSGQSIIELIAEKYPETPVAMITAHGNVDAAVDALKAGAFDFVSKPVDLSVLRRLVQNALRLGEERRAQATEDHSSAGRLLGESPVMQALRATITKVARSQAPVYISGESGVGKELVARLIHEQGPRASGPFVPVNCGAIPTELMESEFFGHRKGSFTGASGDKEGLFQTANGGTLFLDEVAELPLHMQVKLLRVIQEKSVRPIGANAEAPVDVRILSATHKNLAQLVEDGRFRHDLFYRINVIELVVPPLRERRADIPALAQAVLERLAAELGEPAPAIDPDAMARLVEYPFPGNVRELENILERALALSDGTGISVDDLRLPNLREPNESAHDPLAAVVGRPAFVTGQQPAVPADLPDYIERMERDVIVKALEECRYNKTRAAAKLGITFRALRYKLKKLGID
ncbi:MAG TPA: sigma-54 dependent transcriptional regulator [Chiayiivirga sp.]|jgi:two-component system response regulator PilR (NtrC family)|uniref:Sigma-54 dependent transcriptional regulator n=1 Tax=Denitratimonas tolerans TaxID=1338420 RepID=A0AAW9R262_9GAMM|nr:sigma-54 dependent transcriptional regulator [Xanthomonadaceae bacterium]MDX9765442.1 sigma-54 dependent transcriptional regulator [Chiayiivirga sp.]HMN35102.1 sigma-54 dependent transcriptional regulator [Chiayiivirga sp.]HRN59592.1 sigma-54 dependent transcriptional regulator [Chiayiivirga sp.]HRO86473.1 sigma-54 dependent transcriptional regulator [Chiayiivirga sp.]